MAKVLLPIRVQEYVSVDGLIERANRDRTQKQKRRREQKYRAMRKRVIKEARADEKGVVGHRGFPVVGVCSKSTRRSLKY
ncbi:MAG TPA: hypothetical protein VJC04_02330 [Candidatus Paceibacterota bacterium]